MIYSTLKMLVSLLQVQRAQQPMPMAIRLISLRSCSTWRGTHRKTQLLVLQQIACTCTMHKKEVANWKLGKHFWGCYLRMLLSANRGSYQFLTGFKCQVPKVDVINSTEGATSFVPGPSAMPSLHLFSAIFILFFFNLLKEVLIYVG